MKINLDEGYSFGLGVFETIHIYKGKAIFLEEHLKRLNTSLKKLKISETLNKKEVKELLENNFSKEIENQVLKIIVSEKNKIFLKREYSYKKENYIKGFNLNLADTVRNESSNLTFHKTLNYGDNILEKRKSKEEGYDEPIFLNTKKEITEGATTNIFFVKKNKIYTPILECGLLNGILRQYIIENFEVEEKKIYVEDLKEYDEVFLTNSLLGVMPVNKILFYTFEKRDVSSLILKKYIENLG